MNDLLLRPRTGSGLLVRAFWAGAVLFALSVFPNARTDSAYVVLIGAIVAAVALLPCYLWCTGRGGTFPLLPAYSAHYLFAYASPLITGSKAVMRYDDAVQIEAGLTAALFLGVVTMVWGLFLVKGRPSRRGTLVFGGRGKDEFFLVCLALGTGYAVANRANWLDLGLFFSSTQAICANLGLFGGVILCYRIGKGELRGDHRGMVFVLLAIWVLAMTTTLILIQAAGICLAMVLAYILGSKRTPFPLIVALVVALGFLHQGKTEMRERYWGGSPVLSLWDYPGFLVEWADCSVDDFIDHFTSEWRPANKTTAVERYSNIQMLMLVESSTPEKVPYLLGDTYAVIPQMLLPRLFVPNKIWSHEGTFLLAIHYGLQTRETVKGTTIGFSLLSESYANFGYTGVGLLAVLLGCFLGWLTCVTPFSWEISVPMCFDLLFLINVYTSEASAGSFVTALFQGSIVLIGLAMLFARRKPLSFPRVRGPLRSGERSVLRGATS